MTAVKRWRGRSSPNTQARVRAAARAAAAPYLTGEKVRRYESPQMRALHGTAPWPRGKAAKEAHDDVINYHNVEMKLPQNLISRLRARKGRHLGGGVRAGWTLRRANVTRDKKTGEFRSRG